MKHDRVHVEGKGRPARTVKANAKAKPEPEVTMTTRERLEVIAGRLRASLGITRWGAVKVEENKVSFYGYHFDIDFHVEDNAVNLAYWAQGGPRGAQDFEYMAEDCEAAMLILRTLRAEFEK